MSQGRLIGLDGLRGTAAIVVIVAHTLATLRLPNFASMLAVDLFFMISGYVIPYAYEGKLTSGWTFGQFAKARVVRLYPLYILGVAIGVTPFVIGALGEGLWRLREPLKWLLPWALLLLPRPVMERGAGFPLNPPAWSLFMEMVVNILYVVALPWLTTRAVAVIAFVSSVALAAAALRFDGLDFGTSGLEMVWGLARTICPFSIGLLIYRLRSLYRLPVIRVSAIVPPILFLITCMFPAGMVAWATVVVICPIIVLLSVDAKSDTIFRPLLVWAGDISYPLYAIHMPIISGFAAVGFMIGVRPEVSVPTAIPAAFIAAWLAGRYYDPKAREMMAWLLGVRRRSAEAAPAL